MRNPVFKFVFALVLAFSLTQVWAIYPSGEVKLHNAKIKSISKDKLDSSWFDFIYENSDALIAPGKKYKVDQYCSYSLDLDAHGKVLIDSIKLLKHKQNFKYNLKVIQFLRETELVFVRPDATKPIELEFIYNSF